MAEPRFVAVDAGTKKIISTDVLDRLKIDLGTVSPDGSAQTIAAHVADATPHPAYDEGTIDLIVLFENGLI